MVTLKWILFGAITTVLGTPVPGHPKKPGCGEINVILEGLPPNHPTVIAQGYDPAKVDAALKADKAAMIAAGYNARYSLIGTEVDKSVLEAELAGIKWHAAGVGFGVRGANTVELTAEFEDILEVFRQKAPKSVFIFNRSPNTTLEAVKRHFTIEEDCTGKPGKDLGYNIFCDVC